MPIENTSIEGLLAVRWQPIEDKRGFFKQSYQESELAAALGRPPRLAQGNHSRSHAGVLRGFHTEPWDKFVYVPRGTVMFVAADARPDSPTFGRTESFLLGDAPGEFARIFVSRGLSNAFYCHTETDYLNDTSAEFDPANRHGIAWNDPTLAVDWPTQSPILSDTDAGLPMLSDLFPDHPVIRAAAMRAGPAPATSRRR
ncbi:MAG: dTDP-4-dehydrorhamnose 3,5-epimerase family protein [Parvibaculum sp.]